ncbi:hypothetical protein ANRL1_04831 [Anaerolineae bacterium]|nr:hypothetical protein ANRL1_04831 [Anaerolineae bacterium]
MTINIRDRVTEFKKIAARELLDNAGNWRTHPAMQRDALVGVLNEIGMVNALVAYYSERNNGKLTLIDGHLRKEIDPDAEWWIAITDLNDAEADLLLVVFDPLSAMAERDDAKVAELAERVKAEDLAVQAMVRRVVEGGELAGDDGDENEDEDANGANSVPAMNLQPFEHYDYVVLIFRNTFDWTRALEVFGLETKSVGIGKGRSKKVGMCRVVEGAQFVDLCVSSSQAKTA